MPALPKPHRVAFLVPEVRIDGPDGVFEREAAVLLWTACIETCQRHPRLAVLEADATPLFPQDGHFAPSHAGQGGRPTDAFYGPTRRDEVLWLELSLGTQASDRMVGEPTTYTKAWFDAFGDAVDATPLLNEARAIKTPQEIERMRLANEIAAAAMDHVRGVIRPGTTEAQIASEWLGFVHGEGTGWAGKVELALGFSLVWAGPGIKTFTATSNRPVVEGEPTLFEIWVCADGYWADHTKNVVVGELTEPYRELERGLTEVYDAAVAHCSPGASLAELDRLIRDGIERLGYPGQPTHPIAHGVGARAHEPPYAHQAGGGEAQAGMVLAIEPGCYWEGGGGLRLEDNFLVTDAGPEKLSPFPDGIVQAGG